MKKLRKNGLRQWLWQNLSSPVNTGSYIRSTPLYSYAQYNHVELPRRLPAWARKFDDKCQVIDGTIRGATAYHLLLEILEEER